MTEAELRDAMRAGFQAGDSHGQVTDRILAAYVAGDGKAASRLTVAAGYLPISATRARVRFKGLDVDQDDQ